MLFNNFINCRIIVFDNRITRALNISRNVFLRWSLNPSLGLNIDPGSCINNWKSYNLRILTNIALMFLRKKIKIMYISMLNLNPSLGPSRSPGFSITNLESTLFYDSCKFEQLLRRRLWECSVIYFYVKLWTHPEVPVLI